MQQCPDKRTWSVDPSEMFSCKSYFQFLTHSLNKITFHLDKPIWKSKAPSEVISLFEQQCLTELTRKFEGYIGHLMCKLCVVRALNLFHLCFCTILWLNLFGILCLISLISFGYVRELWTSSY